MTTAVFIDTDGRFTYVVHEAEYDLGHADGGRYIYAANQYGRRQLCNGGRFQGGTLNWPQGPSIPGTYREATGRAGHKFWICDHEDLPDDEVLKWLGRATDSKTYKSRASFERHYKKPSSNWDSALMDDIVDSHR